MLDKSAVRDMINILNESLTLDSVAVNNIFKRVECNNNNFLNHQNITVFCPDSKMDCSVMQIGILGIINGIIPLEYRLAAVHDDSSGEDKIVEFVAVDGTTGCEVSLE